MFDIAIIVSTTAQDISIKLRKIYMARLQAEGKTRVLEKKFPAPQGQFNEQFFFTPNCGNVDFSNQHWLSFLPAPSHSLCGEPGEKFGLKLKAALEEIPSGRPHVLAWSFEYVNSKEKILHVQIYSKLVKD